MLHAVILICALTGPCDTATATDVIRLTMTTALPSVCAMQGQAYVAQTELAAGQKVKITCERVRP